MLCGIKLVDKKSKREEISLTRGELHPRPCEGRGGSHEACEGHAKEIRTQHRCAAHLQYFEVEAVELVCDNILPEQRVIKTEEEHQRL